MSRLSEDVRALICQAFPHYKLWTEYYVNFKNTKLYFDFYIPELKIAFEAQGRQHDEFVEHFHGTAFNFQMYRKRDRLKKDWALENGVVIVEMREEDISMSANEFLNYVYTECDLQG
jgi:very-short-patch-repair endonuclease